MKHCPPDFSSSRITSRNQRHQALNLDHCLYAIMATYHQILFYIQNMFSSVHLSPALISVPPSFPSQKHACISKWLFCICICLFICSPVYSQHCSQGDVLKMQINCDIPLFETPKRFLIDFWENMLKS